MVNIDDPVCCISEEIRRILCPAGHLDDLNKVTKFIDKDISFPISPDIWKNYFKCEPVKFLSEIETTESMQELKDQWSLTQFPLESSKIQKSRCILSLNRLVVTKSLFQEILVTEKYGRLLKLDKNPVEIIRTQSLDDENLTNHRTLLTEKCIRNALSFIKFQKDSIPEGITIKCGLVVEPKTKKICELKTSEYQDIRSTDMRLLAMHKYGVRIKNDEKFKELFNKLGVAAATVDLLEVKHTSPVQINRNAQGCTKGASFILYNSARLETLLRRFEADIKSGKYSPLPELDQIDLGLLKEEEEWHLIFTYILGFPNLIKRCVSELDQGFFPIHKVIQYLDGFVSAFSVYYRRTRILIQNRDHLIPIIHARITLLKCLRYILNSCLSILDIEPVQFM